jgi:hypothetical protein
MADPCSSGCLGSRLLLLDVLVQVVLKHVGLRASSRQLVSFLSSVDISAAVHGLVPSEAPCTSVSVATPMLVLKHHLLSLHPFSLHPQLLLFLLGLHPVLVGDLGQHSSVRFVLLFMLFH